MALWGDKDNVNSVGTVTLNYSTGAVTGSGTSFGQAGSAQVGDVIRFGTFPYIGDAVVVGIASTTLLSIGSTAGLSGEAISGAQYSISQLPKYTIQDSTYSKAFDDNPAVTVVLSTAASRSVAINTTTVFVDSVSGIRTGDLFTSGANLNISVASIGSTTVSLGSTTLAGISTGAAITFSRRSGARFSSMAGVSTGGAQASSGTVFETGVGWVGITTYLDFEGTLRVKKEILVAMSGIQTGNGPVYDSNPLV
jgi:hypothetical protein